MKGPGSKKAPKLATVPCLGVSPRPHFALGPLKAQGSRQVTPSPSTKLITLEFGELPGLGCGPGPFVTLPPFSSREDRTLQKPESGFVELEKRLGDFSQRSAILLELLQGFKGKWESRGGISG